MGKVLRGLRILQGLKDAIAPWSRQGHAFARGDTTRGRVTHYLVDPAIGTAKKLEQAPIGRDFVGWIDRRCPDCHGQDFLEGPHGGMCVNIECSNCGSRFNVAIWRGDFALIQRIGHRDD